MCCIIHRPKDTVAIPQSNLEKIIKKNQDGWGISYLDDNGVIQMDKSMDMDASIEKVRALEADNREFLFHARWATHGAKNVQNCHPFKVHKGVMFHNGKMEKAGSWKHGMSDSYHFSKKVIKQQIKKNRSLDAITNVCFKKVIGESRLAFMMEDGTIVKHGIWHEIEGCSYSKIDWKHTWIPSEATNVTRHPYTNYHNNKSRHGFIDLKSIKDQAKNSAREYVSREILEEIADRAFEGKITKEDIKEMDVDDVYTLCVNCPEKMAEYLYRDLHRGGV